MLSALRVAFAPMDIQEMFRCRLSRALVVHQLAMHRHLGRELVMLKGAPPIQTAQAVRPVAAATADTRD